jgi:hypothetical protein
MANNFEAAWKYTLAVPDVLQAADLRILSNPPFIISGQGLGNLFSHPLVVSVTEDWTWPLVRPVVLMICENSNS